MTTTLDDRIIADGKAIIAGMVVGRAESNARDQASSLPLPPPAPPTPPPVSPPAMSNFYPVPQTSSAPAPTSTANDTELRVRLTALNPTAVFGSGGPSTITNYVPGMTDSLTASSAGSGIMGILQEQQVNGIIFPYTPQIGYSQAVSYADLQLVHSNTDYPAYTRTPSVTVSVTAKFTVQNQREGQYALAALHFLRTASKSHFGEKDVTPGLPPPVLQLSGYGDYMFNKLRVIIKNHSWSFDDTVDFTSVSIGSTVVRLPVLFSVQCELMVIQTPQRMRQQFSFQAFASGQLMSQGGWI